MATAENTKSPKTSSRTPRLRLVREDVCIDGSLHDVIERLSFLKDLLDSRRPEDIGTAVVSVRRHLSRDVLEVTWTEVE